MDAFETELTDKERNIVRRLDRLGTLLDDQFRIPLIGYRIGLDPIIGLLPIGGDWVASLVGLYIVGEGVRLEISTTTLLTISARLLVDLFIGWIPAIGDGFDALYKSNRKNVESIKRDIRAKAPETDSPPAPQTYMLALAVLLSLGLLVLSVPFVLVWFVVG